VSKIDHDATRHGQGEGRRAGGVKKKKKVVPSENEVFLLLVRLFQGSNNGAQQVFTAV